MQLPFRKHIKSIDRFDDSFQQEGFLRLHKRERNFPYSDIDLNSLHLRQSDFNYPNLSDCYRSVSDKYDLDPSAILLCSGCDISLRTVYESLIFENIYLPNSCYAMNHVYSKMYQQNSINYLYEYNQKGGLNIKDIISYITATSDNLRRKSLLLLESPSGFTGIKIDLESFHILLKFCQSNNITLVVDETYLETRDYKWSARDFIDNKNLIVVTSFSKSYGIAGLRAGLLISSSENIEFFRKVKPMHEISSFTSSILSRVILDPSLSSFKDQILFDQNLLTRNSKLLEKYDFHITDSNFILFRHLNKTCSDLSQILLSHKIKIKQHLPVKYFGEWCSASLGNHEHTSLLIESLLSV